MSSYQIKSTPYFRRIINNSRNNGQLQNLREEYERIQEFNDRTIEMKMRQVRLKRLFRQIEGIKVLQATPSRSSVDLEGRAPFVVNPSTLDTTQRQRFEALARAREFGKEISRRNALSLQQGGGLHRFGLRSTSKMRASAEARRADTERRERTFARISYGNAQSKCNIQKITQRRLRNRQSRRNNAESESTDSHLHRELSHTLDLVYKEKRTKLQHRLAYGNAQSSSNKERAAAAAAAMAMRRTAAATATATGTTNTMVHPMDSDLRAIANYYDDDDTVTMNPTDDEDEYEDFQSAMVLTPTPSPHDLCIKKTMILQRNIRGSHFDEEEEDDHSTISATRLRARQNWHHLLTLTLPWISLLRGCRKYVDVNDQDESGTNLFVSATETSTHRQPIVNKKLSPTSESFQDILSNNESTVSHNSGIVGCARSATMKGVNIHTHRQGNDVPTAAAAAAAPPVLISELMEEGEEASETEELNSDEKYPHAENEYYYFEDDEEGLEAESPTSGVEDPSSEADNLLSKIGKPEFKNKNQVTKTNPSLSDIPLPITEDQGSEPTNDLVPIDDDKKVDNDDDQGEDTMNGEGFWQTAFQAVIIAKYDVPVQSGNVKRLRKVYEH